MNQRSLLSLGTNIEIAMAMSIQPWMKTQLDGFALESAKLIPPPPPEWCPDEELPPTPLAPPECGEGGEDDCLAPEPSQENSCVAFIKKDWRGGKDDKAS